MATILVVEDEEFELVRYGKILSDEGYKVITARDGYEALEILKHNEADIVVLDIKLPGIDGIETLGKILEVKEDIPVIIHTGYEVWRENFRTRAADAYVLKSKDMTELKAKIKELLKTTGKIR
jgi:DNA-binding response OmpR family regulator